MKEWHISQLIGAHENIVQYTDVILHADEDKAINALLLAAQEQGKIQSKTKRKSFPARYLVLIEEFMERGSVQDWMDQDLLLLGGMFVVMRSVASGLSHMHVHQLTHNDIKPENILLTQGASRNPRAPVTVKIADLGLAEKGDNRACDFGLFGMTVFCMITGEKFGTRKFTPDIVEDLLNEIARFTSNADTVPESAAELRRVLQELPQLLRQIWRQELVMAEVRDWPSLQKWGFFDGEELAVAGSQAEEPQERNAASEAVGTQVSQVSRCGSKSFSAEKVLEMDTLSRRNTLEDLQED